MLLFQVTALAKVSRGTRVGKNEHRAGRARGLRQQDNRLAAETICKMSGRKRKRDDWDRGNEPDQAERRSRMGARVNFPLDRDRQHLATGDRDEVSEGKKDKTTIAKGCVWIARYGRFLDRRRRRVGFSLRHRRARPQVGRTRL